MKEQSHSSALRTLAMPEQIFKVIDKDGRDVSKPLPIFKVEKMARRHQKKCNCSPTVSTVS